MKMTLLLLLGAAAAWALDAKPTGVERDRLLQRQSALSAAVARDPKDAESWRSLGMVYQALGEPQAAREAFKKVVELEPADAAGWYMLALTHEKLGEKGEAARAWRNCLKHAAKPDVIRTAKKHLRFLGAQ